MKKIIGVAFCVLLAGSAGMQSCKKPDAAPDPTMPVIPDTPIVPVVHLTEQQIIQKAIAKLDTDTFNFYSATRTVEAKFALPPSQLGYYYQSGFGPGNNILLHLCGTKPMDRFKGTPLPFGCFDLMYEGASTFYDKIFVNEVGDSFLGAVYNTGGSIVSISTRIPVADVTAQSFHKLDLFLNKDVNFTAYKNNFRAALWPEQAGELQYYYNKDSLVLGYSSGNNLLQKEDTLNIEHHYHHYHLSKAIRKK